MGPLLLWLLGAPSAAWAQALGNDSVVDGVVLTPTSTVNYTFTATVGQNVLLRVVDLAGGAFYPRVQLFGPSGAQLVSTQDGLVAGIDHIVASAGTYTVRISDYQQSTGGAFRLYFKRVSGTNEGGALISDVEKTGVIDLGDLDSYTFSANAGETVLLRVLDVDGLGFYPRLQVYNAAGALVSSTQDGRVAGIDYTVPASGTYTVVLADYQLTGSGNYKLYFDRVPGTNEGGVLSSDVVKTGVIDLGDLDTYTFTANAGENVLLRVVDVDGLGFYPRMQIYNAAGTLVSSTQDGRVAGIDYTVPASGTYTVVLSDYQLTGTGNYRLYYERVPGTNEGGRLYDGVLRADRVDLGDLDSYTFSAQPGDTAVIKVTDTASTGLYPRLQLFGPSGILLASTQDGQIATLSKLIPATGTYTVVVSDYQQTGIGDYTLVLNGAGGAAPDADAPLPLWSLLLLGGLLGRSVVRANRRRSEG